jgi:hypothetical protein
VTEPALGGESLVPDPDPIAADYLRLALRLDQHLPGFVDGYFGPARLKAEVDLEPLRSPRHLAADAIAVSERLDESLDPGRRAWLRAQLVAIEANATALVEAPAGYSGQAYLEQVRRCFDWTPQRRPAELFAAARAGVDQFLPGSGSTVERLAAWDAALAIPIDRLRPVVDWLITILRARARATFGLPDGESLRVSLVTGQQWAGYNWYDGGLRSRVDLNTDLPIRAPDLIGLLAHETYPGHHLEHASKEAQLVGRDARLECSILLINTPECLVSEGLADIGRRFAVSPDDEADLLVELLERAGLAARSGGMTAVDLAQTAIALRGPRARLGEFAVNAALRRHVDGADHATVRAELELTALLSPERAEKRLEFLEHPLWRTYIFVYSEGEALLGRWLDCVPEVDQPARFRRLLLEQLTPATIVAEIDAAGRP